MVKHCSKGSMLVTLKKVDATKYRNGTSPVSGHLTSCALMDLAFPTNPSKHSDSWNIDCNDHNESMIRRDSLENSTVYMSQNRYDQHDDRRLFYKCDNNNFEQKSQAYWC